MKFVVFGPDRRLGVLVGNRVLDLESAGRADRERSNQATDGLEPLFGSLLGLIEAGDRGLDLVRDLIDKFAEAERAGLYADLAQVQLHPPYPGKRFALAGRNYAAHVANAYTNRGQPVTAAQVYTRTRQGPAGGFWAVSPPVGPGADIETPRSADGLFDYEGEVAIVIGKGGKRIDARRWADHVWGTTLVIDWSVRSQSETTTRWPFYAQKNFDCSKSIGPWIAVDEVDPACCDVETRVNGQLRQRFNTEDMIHSFGEIIEQMSQDLTLHPGDVVSGGTGAGTALDASSPDEDGLLPLDLFLKAGDKVEVTSAHLGMLHAQVAPST